MVFVLVYRHRVNVTMRKLVCSLLPTNSILLIYQMEFGLACVRCTSHRFIQNTRTHTPSARSFLHVHTPPLMGVSLRPLYVVQSIRFTIFRVCIIEPIDELAALYRNNFSVICECGARLGFCSTAEYLLQIQCVQFVYMGVKCHYCHRFICRHPRLHRLHSALPIRQGENSTCTLVSAAKRHVECKTRLMAMRHERDSECVARLH